MQKIKVGRVRTRSQNLNRYGIVERDEGGLVVGGICVGIVMHDGVIVVGDALVIDLIVFPFPEICLITCRYKQQYFYHSYYHTHITAVQMNMVYVSNIDTLQCHIPTLFPKFLHNPYVVLLFFLLF